MGQTQFKDFTLENENENFTILEKQINKLKSQGKLTPQVQLKPLQNHRTSVVNFTGQDKQALKSLLDSNLPEIKINSQLQFSLIKQQQTQNLQLSKLMNQYETKISQYIKKKVQQGSKKQQQSNLLVQQQTNTFPSTQITVQQAGNQQGLPTTQQTVTVSTGDQSVAVTTPQQNITVQQQAKQQKGAQTQESSMFGDLFAQAPQQTVTVSTGDQSVAVTTPQQNITVQQAKKQQQQAKQQKGAQTQESSMFGNLFAQAPQQTVTVSTGDQSVAVTTPQQNITVQQVKKQQQQKGAQTQESSIFGNLFAQAPQQTVTVSTGGQVQGQAKKQQQVKQQKGAQTQESSIFGNLFAQAPQQIVTVSTGGQVQGQVKKQQQQAKQQKGAQTQESSMIGNLFGQATTPQVTIQQQAKKQQVKQLSKQQSIAKLYDLLNKITSDSYRHGRTLEQLKRDFQYYQSFLTDKQKDRISLMDASDQSIIDSMESIIQRQIKASQKISDKEELLKSLKQTIQMAKSKGYNQEYSQDESLLEKLEHTFIPEIQKYIQQTRRISQKNIDTNLNYLDQMVQRLDKHKKVQSQPAATIVEPQISMYNKMFGKQIFIPLTKQRQQEDMTKRQTMRNQRRDTQKSNLQKLSKQELQNLLTIIPGQNSKKSQELAWKDFGDLKNRRKMINAVLKK
jgi:hypothetical protein